MKKLFRNILYKKGRKNHRLIFLTGIDKIKYCVSLFIKFSFQLLILKFLFFFCLMESNFNLCENDDLYEIKI